MAAARENYFTEWRSYQRQYRELLLAKAETEAEVKSARGFGIEIRQIVVSDLGAVDRCVTCHLGLDDPRMTDAPQPFRTHSGPALAHHEMERFGCTGCHLGQGRATSAREAHGWDAEAFWEHSVLPDPFHQASCGVCHDPEAIGSRGAPVLAEGFGLFRTEGCLGCHKLGGRGGPLGPALDEIGDRGRHSYSFAHIEGDKQVWSWHVEHLVSPETVIPGSKMPEVGLDESGVHGLVTYLLSLRSSNLTERMTPRDRYEQRYQVWHTRPLSGEELYRQFCFACHEEGTETVLHDTLGTIPSVRNHDLLAVVSREFLVESIHDGRPTTFMPAWASAAGGLEDGEIGRIADYLLESRREIRELEFVMSAAPDVANGERIFNAECTDCHALTRDGVEAPWLGDPGFQATYSDALIGHTIQYGREDTLMIPYGVGYDGDLTDAEVSDLVAFIRTMR